MESYLALVLSVLLINELSIIGANPSNIEIKHVDIFQSCQTENVINVNANFTSLKSEIETRDNQISDQNEQLKNQLKNITDLSKLLQNADEKVNFMITNIGNLQRRLEIAKNEIQNKEDQINDLSNQIKSSSRKISELNEGPRSRCPIAGPSGIYNILLDNINTFQAPCNATGWLTIQKRFDGSENFDRPWKDYKDGFGNPRGEFFIGLEKMHVMTRDWPHELYIKLGDVDGFTGYAHYDDFKIGSEDELYKLKSLGSYDGTAGESLKKFKNKNFTTKDRDNDAYHVNCASDEWGGWWYTRFCGNSKLNGKYYKEGQPNAAHQNRILWLSWPHADDTYLLTFTEMMIRPKTL